MAITAETRNDIIELVVTAYDAAPGTTLLTELVAIVDGGGSLADVAAALTTSDRWTELYPSFQTAEEFAAEWLGALVPEADEDALAEGVSVAVGLLNGGASFADLILEAQGFLSTIEETDASFGTSAANFNNKVEVATNHTVTNELDGSDAELQNVLASVTSDDDTVDDANAQNAEGADGETFNLTDELDTVGGTVNNDTVNGIIGATADTTYNVADSIDLGAGENDQVNVSLIGNGHNLGGHGAAGAERINITYVDTANTADAVTATMGAFSDHTSVWVQDSTNVSGNDDSVTISAIDEDAAVGVANNTAATNVSFTTDGDATSGDSISLNLGGGTTGDVDINDATDGYDTINVVSGGASANTLGSLDGGTDFEEVVITGDQNLTLVGSIVAGGLNSAVETIDASAFTGNLTINASASEDLSATGGSGSDTLALVVTSDVDDDAVITGFETVAFYPTTDVEFNLSLVEGASIVSIASGTFTTAPQLTLTEVAADSTFFVTGLGSATAADANAGVTIELADDDGESDAVSFVFNNLGVDTGTVDQSIGEIIVQGIETLNITADNYDDLDADDIQGNDLTTINYSGDADLDLASSINANSLEEFDGASATGDIHLGGAIDNDVTESTITTGSGSDEVANTALTSTHVQEIDTGDGDDEFTTTDVAAGATVTVDLGDGDDEIVGGDTTNAVPALFQIDGGDGEDSLEVTNANFDVAVGNVEDILLSATPANGLSFIDGDAGDVTITDIAAAGVTLVALDGELDASGVEYVGAIGLTLTGQNNSSDDIAAPSGTADDILLNDTEARDDITGFTATTTVDEIFFDLSDFSADLVAGQIASETGNAQPAAAQASGIVSAAAGASTAATGGGEDLFLITDTTGIDSNADLTGDFTLSNNTANAADAIIVVWYDEDDSQAVISLAVDAGAAADANVDLATATFTDIATISMSATVFGTLTAANFEFQA